MGATAKKTRLAAVAAWLLTRALRRLLGVALLAAVLAAGATIAGRHGADSDGVRRVVKCETCAITRFAKHLRDAGSSSSPSAGRRQLRALRRPGECDRQMRPAAARHDRSHP